MRHDDAAAHAAGFGVGPDAPERVPEHPGVPARHLPGLGAFGCGLPGGLGAPGRGLPGRGQFAADGVRLEVRHPVHGHGAVGVFQHDRPGQRARPRAQVHARLVEQAAAEPEPARGVVVAADQHDSGPGRVQPEQGVLAQFDGVHGRHRAIVDIPGDQDRVHLLRAHGVHQVIEEG